MNNNQVIILQLNRGELKDLIQESFQDLMSQGNLKAERKDDGDPLMKMKEICDLLRVSKVTIHQWKKTGRIPFHRISNRIFFKKSEVLESLKKIDLYKLKGGLR